MCGKPSKRGLEEVEAKILKPLLATELLLEFACERKLQRKINNHIGRKVKGI